ncbi:unnamed protein product [Schistosoma mattheei]|uniref:Uncharacterized protein n=1 Tax=Schistosoma mattheei TaxID=31246 RepID=A0A3P8K045_9TREM|nr:unnamed protein product [Schistosoma mattheei]
MFPGSISSHSLNQLILPTVDWMSQLQIISGNWPSSLGDSLNRDVLVHWCHGATGVIPLMLSAHKITDAILKSGQKTAGAYKSNGFYNRLMYQSSKRDLCMPPLIFEWYNECYLGAAHGFAGILTTLLKVYRLFPGSISSHSLNQLVLPTVDWMSQLQLSNGNWSPSLGDSESHDILVHWCHGATGVIPLMLSAYKVGYNILVNDLIIVK